MSSISSNVEVADGKSRVWKFPIDFNLRVSRGRILGIHREVFRGLLFVDLNDDFASKFNLELQSASPLWEPEIRRRAAYLNFKQHMALRIERNPADREYRHSMCTGFKGDHVSRGSAYEIS